jgi:hypothetical protein
MNPSFLPTTGNGIHKLRTLLRVSADANVNAAAALLESSHEVEEWNVDVRRVSTH